jgi:plasmid stabilization system protein ParE
LDFREELRTVLELIRSHPSGFPILRKDIRRANLRRFPYGVFYRLRQDGLFVLAVVHHARHPRHWQRRG